MSIFSKNLGDHGPFDPSGYAYASASLGNFLRTPLYITIIQDMLAIKNILFPVSIVILAKS